MSEVLFYRLTRSTMDGLLPILVDRSLQRGSRVVVKATREAELARLDDLLWSWGDGSFLPHGLAGGPHDSDQPVLLSLDTAAPNSADVLVLVDGARVDPAEAARFSRTALLFPGLDETANAAAREDWKGVTAAGATAVYWAEEDGKWVEKARAGG